MPLWDDAGMAVTLSELSRVMDEDPREMSAEVLAWAIDVLEDRIGRMAPSVARERYEIRLSILRNREAA